MSLSSGTGSSWSGASIGNDNTGPDDNKNPSRQIPTNIQQQQQQPSPQQQQPSPQQRQPSPQQQQPSPQQHQQQQSNQPQQSQHQHLQQQQQQGRFELTLDGTNNLLNLANIDHANLLNQQQQFRADVLADQQQQLQQEQLQQQASPSSVLSLSTTASIDGSSTERLSSSSSSSAAAPATTATKGIGEGGTYPPGSSVFHTCDAGHYTNNPSSSSNFSSSSEPRIHQDSSIDNVQQLQPSLSSLAAQSQTAAARACQHLSSINDRHDIQSLSGSDTAADIQSLTSQFNLSLLAQSQLFDQVQSSPSSSTLAQSSGQHYPTFSSQASSQSNQSQQLLQSSSSSSIMCPFIQGHGHYFTKKTFHKPSYCHHCADMLWGLIGQGYICEVCNFVVHERCMKTVVSSCSTVASSNIKNPMPHCWTDAHPKRKFCNVCRKRIEDNGSAVRCCVCEYCVHPECQDFSISDCKECATYVPDMRLNDINQRHHWREGNLPQGSAKCFACKKSCWSAECMTGMRCEWCLMTTHASCLKNVPSDCDFGSLKSIILPPYCVSIPRTDVPLETIIGVQNRSSSAGNYAGGPFTGGPGQVSGGSLSSSGGGTKRDNLSPRSTSEDFGQLSNQEDSISRDRDEEMIRVYDGNSAIKKRSFRWVLVLRTANKEQLVAACLRAFHVHDDVSHYVLLDINDSSEKELDDVMPVMNLIKKDKRPSVLLRYRPPDSTKGTLKVYPGRLNVQDTFCSVSVTSDTNVDVIMTHALEQFRLDSTDLNRYRLVEVSLDKGSSVHERTMDNQECPLEIIKNVARESVRQKENTRFYLQQKDDVYCSSVTIFVGNLPLGLNQIQTESLLTDLLGKPYRFKECNPIYYEYGSCIITYDNADIAVKAFYMLRDATVKHGDETRNLLVLLLPNIMADMIPEGVKPLLVFVNVKSGGCQGLELITSFRKLLNPYQVYDLEKGGPLPGLYVFRKIRDYRILVSGGDGSVGWVLQCLDNAGQESECQSPPCAVVPLGTGNDLARVLRWGSGYTGAEDPLNLLKDVIDAEEVILDRWTVVFHPDEPNKQEVPSSLTVKSGSSSGGAEDNTNMLVMNNYLGLGIDADLCLGFHNAREENPDKFNSRLHNKGVYVKQAFRKIVNRKPWSNLNKEIALEVDGRPVTLPCHLEGIIILNILSWGSGANPWGVEVEDRFAKPNHYDGLLEVVGVTGIVHMGQIQGGLSKGIRIAQGGQIKIRLHTEMPIQVDGEPWIQTPGRVNIIKSALKATMLRKTKMKRRNTEPTLTQAERLLGADKSDKLVISEKVDE